MGRRPDLSAELLDAAREVAKKTKDSRELRQVLNLRINGLFFSDYLGLRSLFSCCLDRAGQPGSELGG
ncbi:MAG: hypothetical protein ACP5VS_00775 [Desulfomonilaceae bacterium]